MPNHQFPEKMLDEVLKISPTNQPICTGRNWHGESGTPGAQSTKGLLNSASPVDGKTIASVGLATNEEFLSLIQTADEAFKYWRTVPAPRRGRLVRKMGEKFRENKDALGALVSYEMGKSLQEGKGEVQEIIDICEFATGLSRQLYGHTMHSERPSHRMYEQWHPLGIVGIISAFNFPVAVWAWNAMIAAVCGDVTIWKPSEKTPLSAIACFKILDSVFEEEGIPEGVMNLVIGDLANVGEPMLENRRIPLISATGSTRMGKRVAEKVGSRLGRTILELGGNNAVILTSEADLRTAIPSLVFGAVGTAGQRCTSTRRVFINDSIYDKAEASLIRAYGTLLIGNPLDEKNHMGPLIDLGAVEAMQKALRHAASQGGRLLWGGQILSGQGYESGCYVQPALVQAKNEMSIVQEETFAPILYLIRYSGEVRQAIALQNDVPQGLSSSIFTSEMRDAELFLSSQGSDCGIANVNIGTSGAEIGGAFGGEKDTGGGREAGSDSWKAYMRRQTNTINFGRELPLAQGIQFDLG